MLILTKLGRIVAYFERFLLIKLHGPWIMGSSDITWQIKTINKIPLVTKLSRLMTYLEELLPIKFQNTSITWSCKIIWQIKDLVIPLPKALFWISFEALWFSKKTPKGFQYVVLKRCGRWTHHLSFELKKFNLKF